MALYFFDTYDDEMAEVDEIGLEFPDLESVKEEAARALAELARDVVPGSLRKELVIIVRDEQSRHLLKTTMIFEIVALNESLSR